VQKWRKSVKSEGFTARCSRGVARLTMGTVPPLNWLRAILLCTAPFGA
jgi:hypothetical protein